ncbi:hypothetical protein DB346_08410 [Verrucomicrobia bacterium LW23]|nr:hypothetical protein DB346_08410 [Verrucomicrobia bacterium LW23]
MGLPPRLYRRAPADNGGGAGGREAGAVESRQHAVCQGLRLIKKGINDAMTININAPAEDQAQAVGAEALLAARMLLAATLQSVDAALEDVQFGLRTRGSLANVAREYSRTHAQILARNIAGEARNGWLLGNALALSSSPALAEAFDAGAPVVDLLVDNINCRKGKQCGSSCVAAWKDCVLPAARTGGGTATRAAAAGKPAGASTAGLPMSKQSAGVYTATHHGTPVTISRVGTTWVATTHRASGASAPLASGKTRQAVATSVAAMTPQQLGQGAAPVAAPAQPQFAIRVAAPAQPATRLAAPAQPQPATQPATRLAAPAQPVAPVTVPGQPHNGRPDTARRAWDANKPVPGESLHGIDLKPVTDRTFYERVRDAIPETPPLRGVKIDRVGVIIEEPDGSVWMCKPTNAFGSREYSLPSGTVEKGLTLQQNAIKEAYEETGLQIEITGHAGDFYDTNYGTGAGSRPYRVYRAKRVGGAPWDVAPIKNTPGNPPETERMELMSAEAARDLGSTPSAVVRGTNKLRSDDTSALGVVTPIKLTTPMKAVDKILEGVASRVEEYRRQKLAAGDHPGSTVLHAIQQSRGYNAKPSLQTPAEMDQFIAGGDIEMLRGVKAISGRSSEQLLNEYISGDHYPGFGMFGDGTYADASKGRANATSRGRYGPGPYLRMALKKEAKVIKMSELLTAFNGTMGWGGNITKAGGGRIKAPAAFKNATDQRVGMSSHGREVRYLGLHAALAGYDAIHHDVAGNYGENYYIVLNRSMTRVQQQKVPQGYNVR